MIKRNLGLRVAQLRKVKGLSQEDLANRSSYSVEFISLVERGINAPSLEGIAKLASALSVEIKDLFDFGDLK